MTAPPTGPYWTRVAPRQQPDFANMRRGYTSEFDNAAFDIGLSWERHRDLVLPEYESLLDDPLIGNPPHKIIDGHTVTFGSIEFAAMASLILPHFTGRKVLEIGGGYGGLAHAMLKARPNLYYSIVDLSPQLDCIDYYLRMSGQRGYAYLMTPQFLEIWPLLQSDLYIQTRGFMEMSPEEVAWYMGLIQQHAPVGALFFCINKCSKREQDASCQSRWVDYGWDNRWSIVLADHWQEMRPMPMVLLCRESSPQPDVVETIRSLCS